jgi:predicted ATPase
MYIETFRVRNYKSFRETPEVRLTPGFNVVVGRNNVGKTALVEALSLRFTPKQHQSLATRPRPTSQVEGTSEVEMRLVISREELHEIVGDARLPIYLPSSADDSSPQSKKVEHFRNRLLSEPTFELSAVFAHNGPVSAELRGLGPPAHVNQPTGFLSVRLDDEHLPSNAQEAISAGPGDSTLPIQLAKIIRERIYAFKAERLILGEGAFDSQQTLRPDASNLAWVLNRLRENTARFRRFNHAVSAIFPDVTEVTIESNASGTLRILVASIDPELERTDLAMPLAESGTGIGQVLAILSVVMTSEFPRVILIDEPQSFLHPGAIRKLFEVVRREAGHDHQYIVTTHSPAAVTAADPRSILLVRKEGPESAIDPIDANESNELRLFLDEIGARLADVFGADDILWVEGPTEERCLPLVLRRLTETELMGTVILGVRSIGDLEGKHGKAAFEIYQRLSEGRGLLPPAVGFVFDREGRTDKDREDLVRQSRGRVRFLPRRLYENYLLNPAAIAAVANSIEGFSDGAPITPEGVSAWIERHRWERAYIDPVPPENDRTDEHWRLSGHGANLLADLFNALSDCRVEYNKIPYGVALTEWLLENAPEDLEELAVFLSTALQEGRSRGT